MNYLKEKGKKICLYSIIISFVFTVLPYAQAASLSDLLKKQDELKTQTEKSKKIIEQKKREASNLQGIIADLDDDISSTSNQIERTTQQIQLTDQIIVELTNQITDAQNNLDNLQKKLNIAYVNLYEISQTNTMEKIFESDSMTDLASHTQYIQAIQDELKNSIGEFNALKDQLTSSKTDRENQKSGLEKMNKDLVNSKVVLDSQKRQKDYLLTQTQNDQSKYEEILKRLANEQEKIGKEIYEARRKLSNGNTIFGGTGGYPWANEPNSYAVDPWFFYKRQCVSYAAWKFQAVYGLVFYNTRPGQGSAWNWPALARDQGYHTSSSPRAQSVVSWGIGTNMPYGHVAWVESVNGDGTINVSEYNWGWERSYSERRNIDPNRYGNPTYIYP